MLGSRLVRRSRPYQSAHGKAGYIDPAGEWAIAPTFEKTKSFFGELAVVQTSDAPAYIRTDGKIVWRFEPHAIVPRHPCFFEISRRHKGSPLGAQAGQKMWQRSLDSSSRSALEQTPSRRTMSTFANTVSLFTRAVEGTLRPARLPVRKDEVEHRIPQLRRNRRSYKILVTGINQNQRGANL